MAQLHRRARLGLKTKPRRLVFHQSLLQKLDRDRPVHREMSRAIHGAHAARAETFFDDVLLVDRAAYKRVSDRQCGWNICHLIKWGCSGELTNSANRRWRQLIVRGPPD